MLIKQTTQLLLFFFLFLQNNFCKFIVLFKTVSTNSISHLSIRVCVSTFQPNNTMTSLSLNVGNFITLKLNPTNYPLWHEQALALVESQELVSRLTDEEPAPPPNIPHKI